MPIFEFECPLCGKIVEKFQKRKEKSPTCDNIECNKEKMVKVLSKGSFVLKGKGWYKTDYSGK